MDLGRLFLMIIGIKAARYFVIAGLAYFYFWKWRKKYFENRRIQKIDFKNEDILREITYSSLSIVIFSVILLLPFNKEMIQYTSLYKNPLEYGYLWLIVSLPIMMILHDAYFYWVHRAIHHPKIFKHVHRVHHLSKNPSPFAAFAFHPVEAVVEFAWVLPLMFLMPIQKYVFLAYSLTSISLNVIGHLGIEVYPDSWKKYPLLRTINRSTYHNDHHRLVNGNYGLYFTWWDSWMGTLRQETQDDLKIFKKVSVESRALVV
jgi:sterol desaturase/sphingolipid hydroxylase (fatty acid hydroxylase superfamily)